MNAELEVLQSIYPELQIDRDNATIDVSVSFDKAATLFFDTLSKLEVTYLPPVSLTLYIPKGYPDTSPPDVKLTCEWLTPQQLLSLRNACHELWQSGEEVLYSILDFLHSEASRGFGILDSDRKATLKLHDELRASLLSHQELAVRTEFERHSFACEICLDWRSGDGLGQPQRIPKATLLQIITATEYDRYALLLRKQELEALPSSIHCPRDFCATILPRDPDEKLVICTNCDLAFCAECKRTWHGPLEACRRVVYADGLGARYKALLGDSTKADEKRLMEKLHGRKNLEKLLKDIADEELAEEWRLEHAKACPACGTYIEKAYGCNHLQCGICSVHFCFLCGDYLAANNPYPHYSDKEGACYGKLFEGLTGLEDPLGGLVV
ncbi:protein of unknown function [Taphrina deformans PYCC 5710]|uniref:RBR-type E3 ubiquitin transferase n=1 Tax=Taphrina deformans (strain PYCC 5710 / ATCC 11124 / CBS 356.35 / IMI 108563 / JCM 9778 / NBRC 8474) TaxID=1097556 RepID=R4XF70_TAPDE|nr:protein of unknown function [Taphrina deformans PYCC 5710]|eukprot:CCG84517.1 protein of unknown function [Taphrina deformans PYCC 5710]